MQTSDAPSPPQSASLQEVDAAALLPMLPPLAPVPPPPFHPARLVRSQLARDQVTLLAPSSQAQPLSAGEQLRLMREVTQALAGAAQPQEVLRALLRSLRPVHHFIACSVLWAEEAGRYECLLVSLRPVSKPFLEQTIEHLGREARRYGLAPVQRELAGQTQVLTAGDEPGDHGSSHALEHLAFFFAHPLVHHGTCAGILGLSAEYAGGLPKEQEEFLALVLNLAAMALENAHLHQAKQRLLQEVLTERQQLEQWKDHFLSTVSHELRTPLTPIKGFTQHLLRRSERQLAELASQRDASQQDDLPARLMASITYEQRSLELIQSEAEHLERLVNTLLDVALLQRGKLQLQLRAFDLAELIEQTVRSIRLSAEQQDITLRRRAEQMMVWADRERLRAILGNLLENALKYSPEGAMVQVSLLEHEQEGVVVVSDQGEGIAAEHMEHLFERFHPSSAPGAHSVEGIGVSLYHAQAVLQLHGGRIWAERHEQEAGSTFAFALPRYLPQAVERREGGVS